MIGEITRIAQKMMLKFMSIMPLTLIGIKTSGSESRPRKVELASAHKNATTTVSILHITTKLV